MFCLSLSSIFIVFVIIIFIYYIKRIIFYLLKMQFNNSKRREAYFYVIVELFVIICGNLSIGAIVGTLYKYLFTLYDYSSYSFYILYFILFIVHWFVNLFIIYYMAFSYTAFYIRVFYSYVLYYITSSLTTASAEVLTEVYSQSGDPKTARKLKRFTHVPVEYDVVPDLCDNIANPQNTNMNMTTIGTQPSPRPVDVIPLGAGLQLVYYKTRHQRFRAEDYARFDAESDSMFSNYCSTHKKWNHSRNFHVTGGNGARSHQRSMELRPIQVAAAKLIPIEESHFVYDYRRYLAENDISKEVAMFRQQQKILVDNIGDFDDDSFYDDIKNDLAFEPEEAFDALLFTNSNTQDVQELEVNFDLVDKVRPHFELDQDDYDFFNLYDRYEMMCERYEMEDATGISATDFALLTRRSSILLEYSETHPELLLAVFLDVAMNVYLENFNRGIILQSQGHTRTLTTRQKDIRESGVSTVVCVGPSGLTEVMKVDNKIYDWCLRSYKHLNVSDVAYYLFSELAERGFSYNLCNNPFKSKEGRNFYYALFCLTRGVLPRRKTIRYDELTLKVLPKQILSLAPCYDKLQKWYVSRSKFVYKHPVTGAYVSFDCKKNFKASLYRDRGLCSTLILESQMYSVSSETVFDNSGIAYWEYLESPYRAVVKRFNKWIRDILGISTVTEVCHRLVDAIKSAYEVIKDMITKAFNLVYSTVTDIVRGLTAAFTVALGAIWKFGEGQVNKLSVLLFGDKPCDCESEDKVLDSQIGVTAPALSFCMSMAFAIFGERRCFGYMGSTFVRNFVGSTKLSEWTVDNISGISKWVYKCLTGDELYEDNLSARVNAICTLVAEYNLLALTTPSHVPMSTELSMKISAASIELQTLQNEVSLSPIKNAADRLCMIDMLNQCKAAIGRASMMQASMATRPPTTLVIIHGGPGAGKQVIVRMLIKYCFERVRQRCIAEGRVYPYEGINAEHSVYTRGCTVENDKFMEGYVQQLVIYLDEIFGVITPGSNSDLNAFWSTEWQSYADSVPKPCNMAFEGKGKNWFTSALGIATTNAERCVTVGDPVAFYRRVPFDVVINSTVVAGSPTFLEDLVKYTTFTTTTESRKVLETPRFGMQKCICDNVGVVDFVKMVSDKLYENLFPSVSHAIPATLDDLMSMSDDSDSCAESDDVRPKVWVTKNPPEWYQEQLAQEYYDDDRFDKRCEKYGDSFAEASSTDRTSSDSVERGKHKEHCKCPLCKPVESQMFSFFTKKEPLLVDDEPIYDTASSTIGDVLGSLGETKQSFIAKVLSSARNKRDDFVLKVRNACSSYYGSQEESAADIGSWATSCVQRILRGKQKVEEYAKLRCSEIMNTLNNTRFVYALSVFAGSFTAIGVVGFTLGLSYMLRNALSSVSTSQGSEGDFGDSKGKRGTGSTANQRKRDRRLLKKFTVNSQSAGPILDKILKSQYLIMSEHSELIAHVLGVEGNLFLFNSHVWRCIPNTFILGNHVNGKAFIVSKSICTVVYQPDGFDQIFVAIPVGDHVSDISCHFLKQEDLKRCHNFDHVKRFELDNEEKGSYEDVGNMMFVKGNYVTRDPDGVLNTYGGGHIILEGVNRTSFCGKIIVARTTGQVPKICAIHASGDGHRSSYASPITFESVQEAIRLTRKRVDLYHTMSFTDDEPGGAYTYSQGGYVTPKLTQPYSESVFEKTVFGAKDFRGGSPKIPAWLDMEAYDKNRAKQDIYQQGEYVNMHPFAVRSCLASESNMTGFVYDPIVVKERQLEFMTAEEAIDGIYLEDGSCYVDKFDLTTANGTRMSNAGFQKAKVGEPGPDRDYALATVAKLWSLMMAGFYCFQINQDCLKDELRDHERVNAHKTRLFNVTDFIDNVILKMILGPFVKMLKERSTASACMVGIAPGRYCWDALAKRFAQSPFGNVCGDIAGFDVTLKALLGLQSVRYIAGFYKSGFSPMVYMYLVYAVKSCFYALRFSRGKGYLLGGGNTSGNWLTSLLNTLTNFQMFSIIYAWLAQQYGCKLRFWEAVYLVLYSDDNVSYGVVEWWTNANIARGFKVLFGITFTDANKGIVRAENYLVSEISFLSRMFRFDKVTNTYRSPLNIESVMAQLYYIRRPKTDLCTPNYMFEKLQVNLNNVINELMEFDPEERDFLIDQLRDFINENGLPLVINPLTDEEYVCNLLANY